MVKIIIGPIICFVLLLLVSVAGFVVFKKKYAAVTPSSGSDVDLLLIGLSFFPLKPNPGSQRTHLRLLQP